MTRVVKPGEVRKPDERLREQMRKLELSPEEGEDTLTHIHQTHSLLYITHEVHCVIRLPSVKSMHTDPHRHACVFLCWELSSFLCVYFYMYEVFSV